MSVEWAAPPTQPIRESIEDPYFRSALFAAVVPDVFFSFVSLFSSTRTSAASLVVSCIEDAFDRKDALLIGLEERADQAQGWAWKGSEIKLAIENTIIESNRESQCSESR